ncbi:MAG TPA: hypothetical protein VGS23_07340 [Thermoplasmata archaeon]|nr:hypothetical protein [Thermoplasmata archaeon]
MARDPAPHPPSILPALEALVPDLEARLAGSLDGFTGMIVRAHLPQRWVFVTESSTASLIVSADGKVSAQSGLASPADVTIETTFARLEAALRTRDRSKVPPGPLKVTPHTEKGRRAFEFLRARVGL